MDALQWIISVIVALFGGGGLVAWYRARNDKRLEKQRATLQDHTAQHEWWKAQLAAQASDIVEPLRKEVNALRVEVADLRREVNDLRARYWRAIGLIRSLYEWIAIHRTPEHPEPPEAHADIREDI